MGKNKQQMGTVANKVFFTERTYDQTVKMWQIHLMPGVMLTMLQSRAIMHPGCNSVCCDHSGVVASLISMWLSELWLITRTGQPYVQKKRALNLTLKVPLPHFTCHCFYQPQRWDYLEWNHLTVNGHWWVITQYLIGYWMWNYYPLNVYIFFLTFYFHFLLFAPCMLLWKIQEFQSCVIILTSSSWSYDICF